MLLGMLPVCAGFAALVALVADASLRAQGPAGASTAPLTAITSAEAALQTGNVEAALLQLWSAQAVLPSLPAGSARDAATAAIDTLLARADPLHAERTPKLAAAARPLLALARAYRSKQWHATAAAVTAHAAAFDPATAAKEVAQPSAAPASTANPIAALGRFDMLGDWVIRDGALWSPAALPATSASYVTNATHADHRFAATVEIGRRAAMFGLLIGCGEDLQYIVDYDFHGGGNGFVVTVYRWDGRLHEFASANSDVEVRTAAILLEVFVRGKALEVRCASKTVLTAVVDAPVRGRVGFYVSGSSSFRGALAVRDIEVGPLPEHVERHTAAAADAAEQKREKDVEKAIADAERLVQRRQPEDAVARLRTARDDARSLRGEPARRRLLTTIDQRITQQDSLHARRSKAFAEAAAALLTLADAYAAVGLPQAATAVAAAVERLDPEAWASRAAVFRAATATAKSRAAAAHQGSPIDDGALAAWFKNGERPSGATEEWQFGFDGAASPRLAPGESGVLLARTGDHAASAVRVRCRVPDGMFGGLVFGWREGHGAARAIVGRSGPALELRVERQHGTSWRTVARTACMASEMELAGSLEIAVEYGPDGIVAQCLEGKLVLPAEGRDLRGRFGLCAGNAGRNEGAVGFAGWRPPDYRANTSGK